MMGHLGRYLEIKWADLPDVVTTMMAEATHLAEASTAAMATVWAASTGGTACGKENRDARRSQCCQFPTVKICTAVKI
jgi:putative hemolysin